MGQIGRRQCVFAAGAVLALGVASASLRVGAQAPDKVRRIGFITLRSGPNEYDAAFRDALRGLGYVEGRSIEIEYRWAAGSTMRADELAAELVARKVEVIVAATNGAIRASMRATKAIPIVIAATDDPVASGLVASLARPGGNVTGLSLTSPDTAGKRLQLLHDLIPSAKQIAVLGFGDVGARSAGTQPNPPLINHLQTAGRQLGLTLSYTGISSGAELESAFVIMQRERAQALIVAATPVSIDNRVRIAELAAHHRLPAIYEVEGFVDAGGLLSYGPNLVDMYRRAAGYVDRILKGAKPADMPVEMPIKYEMAINLKTARALGLQIPASVILRADRIIE